MKRFLIVFAVLAATCIDSYAGIRVMSYNIRNCKSKDGDNAWEIRKPATPAMIYDIRPAVFGVQEAWRNQLDYILEQCPAYREVSVGREDGAGGGEHMAVFYDTDKIKLLRWGNFWLSETPDRPSLGWDAQCRRTATWTLLETKDTGTKFYFVNTHLDHRGKLARKNGLKLIYDKIRELNKEAYPMVLTGDFNVRPDDEGLTELNTLMKPARFTAEDADKTGSFNGFGKYGESESAPTLDGEKKALLPIDYIYWSGFSACKSFRVVTRKYCDKPYVSDHYPVWSDLEF